MLASLILISPLVVAPAGASTQPAPTEPTSASSSIAAPSSITAPSSVTETPRRMSRWQRLNLRARVFWWKALLFEMRKNDILLNRFGTGNGFSPRNLIVGTVNTSILPLATSYAQYRGLRKLRRYHEAKSILRTYARGEASMMVNGALMDLKGRELEAERMRDIGNFVKHREKMQAWSHKTRYVRNLTVVGITAVFLFDIGATWLQISLPPGTLDRKRGELEQAIDQAEWRLRQN